MKANVPYSEPSLWPKSQGFPFAAFSASRYKGGNPPYPGFNREFEAGMTTLTDILKALPGATLHGTAAQEILELKRLDEADSKATSLIWCSDKNIGGFGALKAGTVICSMLAHSQSSNQRLNYIVVENPRLAFQTIAATFFQEAEPEPQIAASAHIHPSVKIGKAVSIGHNVVIDKDCVIGDHSSVGPNTVLHRRTIVADHVKVGANTTIGGVGFGYERDEAGKPLLIPHLGNVAIGAYAEIGNNTAIDRAVLGSTVIEEHVKIDNLVHVGHGAKIKRGAFLIANSMIGGSTVVGAGTWVAPSAALINGITIGEKATIGMGAVVIRAVPDHATVVGNPGKEIQKTKA